MHETKLKPIKKEKELHDANFLKFIRRAQIISSIHHTLTLLIIISIMSQMEINHLHKGSNSKIESFQLINNDFYFIGAVVFCAAVNLSLSLDILQYVKKIFTRLTKGKTQSLEDEKDIEQVRFTSHAKQKPATTLVQEESIYESGDKNLKNEQVYINVQQNEDPIANKVSN